MALLTGKKYDISRIIKPRVIKWGIELRPVSYINRITNDNPTVPNYTYLSSRFCLLSLR